jgi:hypothetical protein
MSVVRVTWREAAAWRVRRQYLDRRAPAGSLVAVASRLCGLHAQVLSSAELTAWARIEDFDRGAVQRALWEERTLVKTWAMRGTLHLLPSRELPLWHAVLGISRRYLRAALWKKYFGITLDELDRITDAIGTALEGRVMTREELVREVGRLMRSRAFAAKLAASSWGTLLKPAAFGGRLCFGPSVGQRVRFTCPDTWISPTPRPVDTGTASAEVTRRFLSAYGPATYHDLARWWTGGGVATAREWIAALGDDVRIVDLEGAQAWMLAADVAEIRDLPAMKSVRLLPAFDQYIVGASWHAEHLLPGDLRSRVYRPQGWLSPVVLVNGHMRGTWRHDVRGSRVDVVIEPFVNLPAWVRRAASQEAERLAHFLDCTLNLVWKS